MPLVPDIAQRLQVSGFGTVNKTIFKYRTPDNAPELSVTVAPYGGEALDDVWDGEHPRLQVKVRAGSSKPEELQRAYDKANAIMKALHGTLDQVIGAGQYLYIKGLNSPEMIVEGGGATSFVVNFSIDKVRE